MKKRPRQQPQIIRLNAASFHWGDFYHLLFTRSLPELLGAIAFSYLALNLLFAGAYLLDRNGIANAQPGSFQDAFFFSVQTLATIGYGAMSPQSTYTHVLVVIESFIGLLGVAMATGLMFARFSQPTARVLFSEVAVICPYNGVPTLMLRAANQRNNLIVEAEIKARVLLPELTSEGHQLRRLYDLQLTRSQTSLFLLSWMVMHPIDEGSPLYGKTAEMLNNCGAQLIITLQGLDETVKQTMHARHIYEADEIVWNRRFVDVVSFRENGDRAIDYARFHETIPLED